MTINDSRPKVVTTNQTLVTVDFFGDTTLDSLAQEVLDLHVGITDDINTAHKLLTNAMYRRWLMGKAIYENQTLIKEVCGTQKVFAETIGLSEATISNNKRGYVSLKEAGANTWEQVVELLQSKGLQPNTYTFERVGKLLADPNPDTTPKQQRPKDEKRLEQLASEIEEIVSRNESSHIDISDKGLEILSQAEDAMERMNTKNVYESTWRSEKYLALVRNLGLCAITGEHCKPDPHHVLPSQRQSQGRKVADVFTIPLSRETHEMVENKLIDLSEDEIKDALIETMATIIVNNLK